MLTVIHRLASSKNISVVFCDFFQTCFHYLTLLSKNGLFFHLLLQDRRFGPIFHSSRPVKNTDFQIELPQMMQTSLNLFLFGKSRLLQFKSHFAVFPECRSCPGISPQRCHALVVANFVSLISVQARKVRSRRCSSSPQKVL